MVSAGLLIIHYIQLSMSTISLHPVYIIVSLRVVASGLQSLHQAGQCSCLYGIYIDQTDQLVCALVQDLFQLIQEGGSKLEAGACLVYIWPCKSNPLYTSLVFCSPPEFRWLTFSGHSGGEQKEITLSIAIPKGIGLAMKDMQLISYLCTPFCVLILNLTPKRSKYFHSIIKSDNIDPVVATTFNQ